MEGRPREWAKTDRKEPRPEPGRSGVSRRVRKEDQGEGPGEGKKEDGGMEAILVPAAAAPKDNELGGFKQQTFMNLQFRVLAV